MLWPQKVQQFLSQGNAPSFYIAFLISPVEKDTGVSLDLGYWSGEEDIKIDLGGASRDLQKTHGALFASDPIYEVGTNIRTQEISMFGLGPQGQDLVKAYDVKLRPASLWQLCFTQGQVFLGARRIFSGVVDASNLEIGKKGEGATLTLTLASGFREGTKTLPLMKSGSSYLERGGDTAMEYAALTDVDSDTWGPE